MSIAVQPDASASYTGDSAASASVACPSCDTPSVGDYCHRCGGRVAVSRLTLRALGAEILSQVVELDHGVLHTLVLLLRRPGATIRGYFAGRRRGITSPLAFVTISIALTLLIANVVPNYGAIREEQLKSVESYRSLYSAVQYDFFVKLEHDLMQDKVLLLVLLLVPTTLTMRFLFRKQKLNLAETGALVCYMYGTSTFVGPLFSVPLVFAGKPNAEMTIAVITTVAFVMHLSYGVFGKSFRTTWRALWALFSAMLLMQAALIVAPYLLAR